VRPPHWRGDYPYIKMGDVHLQINFPAKFSAYLTFFYGWLISLISTNNDGFAWRLYTLDMLSRQWASENYSNDQTMSNNAPWWFTGFLTISRMRNYAFNWIKGDWSIFWIGNKLLLVWYKVDNRRILGIIARIWAATDVRASSAIYSQTLFGSEKIYLKVTSSSTT